MGSSDREDLVRGAEQALAEVDKLASDPSECRAKGKTPKGIRRCRLGPAGDGSRSTMLGRCPAGRLCADPTWNLMSWNTIPHTMGLLATSRPQALDGPRWGREAPKQWRSLINMKRTTRSSSCAALKAKCATNARAQSRSVGQISMPFRQTSGEAQCGNTAGRADLPRLSACVRTWLLVNYALPLTWHRFVSGLGGNWHQPPTEELGKRCQAQGTQGGR